MQKKYTRKIKPNLKKDNKRYWKKKSFIKKTRRIYSSLDRLYKHNLGALRGAHQYPKAGMKYRLLGRTLRIIGPLGKRTVSRSGALLRRTLRAQLGNKLATLVCSTPLFVSFMRDSRVSQRYRVKGAVSQFEKNSRFALKFRPYPVLQLRKAYRAGRQNNRVKNEAARFRNFTCKLVQRAQARLWARHLGARQLHEERWQHPDRRQKRVPFRFRKVVLARLSRAATRRARMQKRRLQGIKARKNRSGAAVTVTFFRRYWAGDKVLKRRRRYGKRAFAGIFGRLRWRLERRDKAVLRRFRRSYPLSREVFYRTSTAHGVLRAAVLGKRKAAAMQSKNTKINVKTGLAGGLPAYLRVFLRRAVSIRGRISRTVLRKLRKRSRLDAQNQNLRTRRTLFNKTSNLKRVQHPHFAKQSTAFFSRRKFVLPKWRILASRYRKWASHGLLRHLSLQKILRQARFTKYALPLSAFTPTTNILQALLNAPALGSAVNKRQIAPRLFRNSTVNLTIPASRTNANAVLSSATIIAQPLLRIKIAPTESPVLPSSFLNKSTLLKYKTSSAQNQSTARTNAQLTLAARRYRELQFYRRRPRLRLPEVAITRRRRRQKGRVTFIRNSLKRPQTHLGQQHLFLPPVRVYAPTASAYAVGHATSSRTATAKKHREDLWPVFWRRPHTRANIKAVNRLRRARYAKRKRQYTILRKRRAFQKRIFVQTVTRPVLFSSLPPKNQGASQSAHVVYHNSRAATQRLFVDSLRQRLKTRISRFARRQKKQKLVSVYAKGRHAVTSVRMAEHLTPTFSRTARKLVVSLQSADSKSSRMQALLHARSVRGMLANERALSAWSPQISIRTRRAHYPRVGSVPVARRWLSFKAKRDRRTFNAKLLARNIPQRRYIDYAPIKLQYYFGSVGSSGYSRFRRVYRTKSAHNRWWRSNKTAAPFAHPHSRRSLNASAYADMRFAATETSQQKTFSRNMRDSRGVSLHSKFPPRMIPWRNFKFPRPRRGTPPRTLSRWTFTLVSGKTGRVAPLKIGMILPRAKRDIRNLADATPAQNVWKKRRWSLLDNVSMQNAALSQSLAAIGTVPVSTWTALRKKSGSTAAYAAIQKFIFSKLRFWVQKQVAESPQSVEVRLHRVQTYLCNLLASALTSNSELVAAAFSSARQHASARVTANNKRVDLRALRFLQLRELPKLGGLYEDVTQRENSALYKKWLGGAEGVLKKAQAGYTATVRSRYTYNAAIAFGRRRVRFPASGRRRKSYDSLLHAFSKKIAPAQFRRVSKLRFVRVLPKPTHDYRERLFATGAYCGLNRRRRLAQELSAVSYLSSPWRELLRYRARAGVTLSRRNVSKRRFSALPVRRTFREKRRAFINSFTGALPMCTIRSGVLRRALRRRRRERALVDLRHSVLQRKLPREQASRPWKLRRIAKRKRAAKTGPYSRFNLRRRAAVNGKWTLSHLSAVGPRRESLHLHGLPNVLSSGENVSIARTILRKNRHAFRGFVLPVNRKRKVRKLRRHYRDTRKRRRPRRAKRASRTAYLRNTKHWSEKKDRLLRGLAFGHRRIRFAKKFVKSLRARTLLTAAPGKCRSITHVSQKTALFTQTGVSSTRLRLLTSLRRFRRNWKASWKSRLTQMQHRNNPNLNRLTRKKRFAATLAKHQRAASFTTSSRLAAPALHVLLSPLWFQKPVVRAVKSELAKEKDLLAEIAAKEDRYKITAQYAESVTSFIPELMNYLMSKRIKNTSVDYNTAKHLVRNIYWSLRVYLNVDPFDTRFYVRDKLAAARVRLFEDVSDLSEGQKTEQPQRAVLRYRFQPSRLIRAPNTFRFRGDWLRAFFPAKHALYQENPDDYGNFLLTTTRIRRLRIGGGAMSSWITTKRLLSHETQARQLLTLKYSRTRARFDTLLQTTRRTPQLECSPVAAILTEKTSFFSRSFSTYAARGLSLTARWIHRQKRFIALEEGWRSVSPVTQVTARNRTISRLETRGKTRYLGTSRAAITTTFLDTRFTRAKSPRSRQYIVRISRNKLKKTTAEMRYRLTAYRALRQKLTSRVSSSAYWTRSTRGAVAVSYQPLVAPNQKSVAGVRGAQALRRRHTTLFAQSGAGHFSFNGPSPLYARLAARRTRTVTHRRGKTLSSRALRAKDTFLRLRKLQKGRKQPKRGTFRRGLRTRRTFPPSKLFHFGNKVGLYRQPNVSIYSGKIRPSRFFRQRSGRQFVKLADFARACALHTRFRRQTPFDTYRPQLWNKLTLRWMKKYRIGRYWLRDTARWLRDPWLSEIVACDMSLRPDRFGGELRSRQQQVGEYVAEVDAEGKDIARKDAPKERHKYQKILPSVKDKEFLKTNRLLKRAPLNAKLITKHRLSITDEARRKPVPGLRLANYEYRDVIREHKENKAKSAKQKEEEELLRVKAYWSRKAKKLPPERPRRLPLKHPANLWLPHVIWKEIQRRVRKFEWRESDEVFFRKGFQKAFQFYPNERRKAPWLEHLLYTRATYSTRLREFRRRQYPHEQKKFKWLQRVRKMLYPGRQAKYIKWRRWPQLRRYNQKLHYSLFNLRDRGAARRHFKSRVKRTRPSISAFISMSRGLTDRLDVTCLQLGFAPSIYWARIVSKFGLLAVNGKTIYDPAYVLKPADVLYPAWDIIARFQHYFKPYLKPRDDYRRQNRASTAFYPTNMEYHSGTRAIVYKHAPDVSDLRRSNRLRATYYKWFKLDSV